MLLLLFCSFLDYALLLCCRGHHTRHSVLCEEKGRNASLKTGLAVCITCVSDFLKQNLQPIYEGCLFTDLIYSARAALDLLFKAEVKQNF